MTTLSLRRLEWLLRARGTDMQTWPAAERVAAVALLRRSAEAQAMVAEALDREADEEAERDCVLFDRMQAAVRRRLAPLPAALRGLSVALLIACVAAGSYLALADAADADGGDLFNTAQTLNLAALDQ